MHEILKERVWRRLQALPQEQLYQVLDYVEFLETKYAREQAMKADPIQKFAERLEDGMRMRSVAPKVITGTFGLLGTARRVLRTVSDAGREILGDSPDTASRPPSDRPRQLPPSGGTRGSGAMGGTGAAGGTSGSGGSGGTSGSGGADGSAGTREENNGDRSP